MGFSRQEYWIFQARFSRKKNFQALFQAIAIAFSNFPLELPAI